MRTRAGERLDPASGQPHCVAQVAGALAVVLGVQLVVVRPALTRRTDAVLRGGEAPRSRAHLGYVGLEIVKVVLLVALGVTASA